MSEQLIIAKVLERAGLSSPARRDWYVIIAYSAFNGWTMLKGQCVTEDTARKVAEGLSVEWTHWDIVRIPGHAK